MKEKGVGLAVRSKSAWILADRVPACSAQVVVQTSDSFQLHSQTVVEPGQGTLHDICLPNLEL